MNIKYTIGIKNIENLKKIKDIGISNIYCGYLDNEIVKKFPEAFCIINRRGENSNICGKRNFKKFALEAKKQGLNSYITFNGLCTPEQYDWLLEAIKYVSSFDAVKGIIVCDIGLLLRLKQMKYNKHIVISTGGTTFNSSTVSFYKQFGITRIVLDRQLKTDEIKSILENHKDINFEIFITFGNCLFVDGFCSFLHTMETQEQSKKEFYNLNKEITMCGKIYGEQIDGTYKIKNNSNKHYLIKPNNNFKGPVTGCNLCNINKLKNFSDKIIYKIVSRGNLFFDEFNLIIPYLNKLSNIENEKDKELIFKKIFNYYCNKTGCYANEEII